jgi:cell division protein FtsB
VRHAQQQLQIAISFLKHRGLDTAAVRGAGEARDFAGVVALLAEIDTLKADRAALEISLERLRDRTLDLDYVEEIARTRLSYVRPDEVLVAVR